MSRPPLSDLARAGFYRIYNRLHSENKSGVELYLKTIFSPHEVAQGSLELELFGFSEDYVIEEDFDIYQEYQRMLDFFNAQAQPYTKNEIDAANHLFAHLKYDIDEDSKYTEADIETLIAIQILSEYEWQKRDDEVANNPEKLACLEQLKNQALIDAAGSDSILIDVMDNNKLQ